MSDETKIKGMGAIPHEGGVAFRMWAPHAQQVSVIGSFNDWDGGKHPMQAEESGDWYADVAEAHVGDQYRFLLTTAKGEFKRIDPYAREVTSSVGDAIVHDHQRAPLEDRSRVAAPVIAHSALYLLALYSPKQ